MLQVAALEDKDHRLVLLRGTEHSVELLLGHLAEDALAALARVVDVEGCVGQCGADVQSTTSASGIVRLPELHDW